MCPRYTIGYCGYTHQHQPPGGSSSAAQDCPEDKGWVLLGARFPPGKGSSTGFWTWELKPPRPLNRVLPSSFHHLLPVTQHFCLWLPRFTTPVRFPLPSKTELKGWLRGPPVLEVPLHRNDGQQERPPSRPIRVSGGWGLSLQASGSSAELSIPSSSMEEQRTAGQSQTGVECWGDYPRPGPPQGQGP